MICAVDIDLHRLHAWSNVHGVLASNSSLEDFPLAAVAAHGTVLLEVASPVFYDTRPAVLRRVAAWALWNVYAATRIWETVPHALVSPSSVWTNGLEEKVRQEMAGVTGTLNHDLREAATMVHMYQMAPHRWVPLEQYFKTLSATKGR